MNREERIQTSPVFFPFSLCEFNFIYVYYTSNGVFCIDSIKSESGQQTRFNFSVIIDIKSWVDDKEVQTYEYSYILMYRREEIEMKC